MIDSAPCPEPTVFEELLSGTFAEADEDCLAQHLDRCAACRRTLDQLAKQLTVPAETLRDRTSGIDTAEANLARTIKEMISPEPCPERTEPAAATEERSSLDFLESSDDPTHLGRLGPYEIIEIIGQGAMGMVLKGHDLKLNRTVAIKVLAPELAANATARRRFMREAQAAAAVSHYHVVTIHAVDDTQRLPYLVMEYVDGRSLQQRIDAEGPLEIREILRIGMQVASGLAAAHAQGLIHRDIKPSNIMLENGVERVKITDFGLARAIDDVGMTRTGEVAGTPQYMSPEQATGQPLDCRSDLFSLGSVLYAMCTGRTPFRADCAVAVLRRVCDDEPRPIRQINAEVPDWLVVIVEQLLAKDPAHRFQEAGEVADLLGRHLAHLQHPSQVAAPPAQKRSRPSRAGANRTQAAGRRSAKRRWLFAGLVVGLLLAGLGLTESTGVTHLAATVIRIVTGEGTLVVQVDDPEIDVTIDGEQLVVSGAGIHELRLRPGDHQVRATRNGQPIFSELVSITRGGREVVRVTLEPPTAPEKAASLRVDYICAPKGAITEVRRFVGHDGPICSLAATPEGRHLLSGARDQKPDTRLRLWDVQAGLEARLFDQDEPISAEATLSPSGRFLAVKAYDSDHSVILIDFETGRQIRRFGPHPSRPNILAFSGNDRYMIAKSSGTGWLWEVETGRVLRRLGGSAAGAAFSPDGRILATGDQSGLVLFDVETGRELQRIDSDVGANCAIAFTGDGNRVIAGATTGRVAMWDVSSGEQVRRFEGHRGWVRSVVLSADDRFLITGSEDKTMRVWAVETGREVACVETRNHVVSKLVLLPDGRHVASGGGSFRVGHGNYDTDGDFAIRLWRLPESVWPKAEGKKPALEAVPIVPEVRRLDALQPAVSAVAFSPDGRLALTGGGKPGGGSNAADFSLQLWDVQCGTEIRRLSGHNDSVCVVVFSPNGLRALSGGDDKTLRLWDVDTGEQLHQLSGHTGKVRCIAFLPDGRRAISGAAGDGNLILWDLEAGKELRRFDNHVYAVWGVAVTGDGRRALCGGGGEVGTQLLLWDLETGEQLQRFKGHTDAVLNVAVLPDGARAVSGDWGGTIRVWDLESGRELPKIVTPLEAVLSMAVCPDGRRLLVGGSTGGLWLYDLETAAPMARFAMDESMIPALAVTRDGQWALSGSFRGVAHLWRIPDLEDRKSEEAPPVAGKITEVRRFEGHTHAIWGLAISPDGKHALSAEACGPSAVCLWDIATGRLVRRVPGPFDGRCTAFSPDGRLAATGYQSGSEFGVHLWNVENGELASTFSGHSRPVCALAFSPDGSRLASGSVDTSLRIWDTRRSELLHRCQPSKDGRNWTSDIAFSPDGRHVLAAHAFLGMVLWDAETGEEVRRFDGVQDSVWTVALSPDGRLAASAGQDSEEGCPSHLKVIRLWDVETGEQIGILRGHTNLIRTVRFSSDGKWLVTGSLDKTIRVWNVATCQEAARAECATHATTTLALCPDGRHAITGGGWYRSQEGDQTDGDYALRLWCLPESAWPIEARIEEAGRRIEVDPDDLDARRLRAKLYIQEGLWTKATEDMAVVFEAGRDLGLDAATYAVLLLRSGQHEQYRQFCQSLLDGVSETNNAHVATKVTAICLLVSGNLAVDELPIEPIDARLATAPEDQDRCYKATIRAQFAYRSGRYEDALDWVQEAERSTDVKIPHLVARQLLIRAMAEHGQGNSAEAREAFSAATRLFDRGDPFVEDGGWRFKLAGWLMADLLLHEAAELLVVDDFPEIFPVNSKPADRPDTAGPKADREKHITAVRPFGRHQGEIPCVQYSHNGRPEVAGS